MATGDYQPQGTRPEQSLLEGALHLITILRSQWRLVVTCTAVVAVLATAFAVATRSLPGRMNPLPNQFTSNATVFVRQGTAGNLSDGALSSLTSDTRVPEAPTGFEYSALLLRMLASRVILDRIVSDLDLAPRFGLAEGEHTRARAALLKASKFVYARDSGTLTISFQNPDPVLARDVVARYVALLGDWSDQMLGTLKENETQLLQQKLVEVQTGVTSLQNQVKALQKKYGFLSAQDLGAAQAGTLADLRSQLILKEIDIRNYSAFAKGEDPRLRTLQTERQNILDMISQVEAGLPGLSSSQGELPDVATQYASLSLQLEIQQGIYNTLSRQYEIAKLTAAPEPVFQTLEGPEIPDVKSGPQRSRIVLVATLFALVLGCGIAFLRHSVLRLRAVALPS